MSPGLLVLLCCFCPSLACGRECYGNRQCVDGVCECTNGKAGTVCDVNRHVLMRVSTDSRDAGTAYGMWTNNTFTPAIGDSVGPEYFSHSVNDKQRYKSPLVECSWSHMKNIRYSYYKGGKEVAYFSSSAVGTDKISWFGKDYVYNSSFTDLVPEASWNYFSINGHPGKSIRRFFVNKNYGGCNSDAGWFVLLDTDHNNNCNWETFPDLSILPFLMYCPHTRACRATGYEQAEVMQVTADLGDAFGGDCVSSCVGMADGNYQSCLGCNVYVVCDSQNLTYALCRNGTSFDIVEGCCVKTSRTCTDNDVEEQCRPNGTRFEGFDVYNVEDLDEKQNGTRQTYPDNSASGSKTEWTRVNLLLVIAAFLIQ